MRNPFDRGLLGNWAEASSRRRRPASAHTRPRTLSSSSLPHLPNHRRSCRMRRSGASTRRLSTTGSHRTLSPLHAPPQTHALQRCRKPQSARLRGACCKQVVVAGSKRGERDGGLCRLGGVGGAGAPVGVRACALGTFSNCALCCAGDSGDGCTISLIEDRLRFSCMSACRIGIRAYKL